MCLCGKNDVESADDAVRVVGGKEAAVDKHPWQAESPGCCCCCWCCCTCSGCWWQGGRSAWRAESAWSCISGFLGGGKWRDPLWWKPDIKVYFQEILKASNNVGVQTTGAMFWQRRTVWGMRMAREIGGAQMWLRIQRSSQLPLVSKARSGMVGECYPLTCFKIFSILLFPAKLRSPSG